jgi:hypothetical protein
MRETQITTISEFISFVEKNCTNDCILFRGQSQDYTLLPKIARLQHRGSILDCESEMIEQFKRYSKPHLKRIPTNDWEWLSLAQHHGMATRLLDWSINPLAALWFATHKPISADSYGVVWIFDVPIADIVKASDSKTKTPFTGKRTSVFQPDIMTNRIQAQLGWFTVHKYITDKENFIPLEKNRAYKDRFIKIKILASSFSLIRYNLDRLGINRMTMFPDLDGIAHHVEWLKSYHSDESLYQNNMKIKYSDLKIN